jgi:hypothetical protein
LKLAVRLLSFPAALVVLLEYFLIQALLSHENEPVEPGERCIREAKYGRELPFVILFLDSVLEAHLFNASRCKRRQHAPKDGRTSGDERDCKALGHGSAPHCPNPGVGSVFATRVSRLERPHAVVPWVVLELR